MIKLLYFLTSLFLIGCGNSNKDKTTATQMNDSIIILKNDTLSSLKEISVAQKRLDSIDKVYTNRINKTDESHIQKATISAGDSSIWIGSNMKYDHRIFGYENPDTASKKMILISIFTNDVERNPFNCLFGSYYKTSDMESKNMRLKFVSQHGKFISASLIRNDTIQATVYIEKKWVEFED